jgi:hypothetical protein
MPLAYVGSINESLFAMLSAGRGQVPSTRQLRRILEGELAKTPRAKASDLRH